MKKGSNDTGGSHDWLMWACERKGAPWPAGNGETRPRLSRVVDVGLRRRGNTHADRNLRHHAVV
jgi:hypothetical protein